MNKLLVVVDMQNDFITGALANTEGQKIVPDIAEYIRQFDGDIVCTLDTHSENYLETQEGRKLPIKLPNPNSSRKKIKIKLPISKNIWRNLMPWSVWTL